MMMDDHPDTTEMKRRLDETERKVETIFEVVFAISQYDAEVLIRCWGAAQQGEPKAVASILLELEKLVEILIDEIIAEEEEYEDGEED